MSALHDTSRAALALAVTKITNVSSVNLDAREARAGRSSATNPSRPSRPSCSNPKGLAAYLQEVAGKYEQLVARDLRDLERWG